jgi:hypothetical protein
MTKVPETLFMHRHCLLNQILAKFLDTHVHAVKQTGSREPMMANFLRFWLCLEEEAEPVDRIYDLGEYRAHALLYHLVHVQHSLLPRQVRPAKH